MSLRWVGVSHMRCCRATILPQSYATVVHKQPFSSAREGRPSACRCHFARQQPCCVGRVRAGQGSASCTRFASQILEFMHQQRQ